MKVGDFFNFNWTNVKFLKDIFPGMVVEVVNAKTIVIEVLKAVETPEGWNFERNPGYTKVFTLRKNGSWVEKSKSLKSGYYGEFASSPVRSFGHI